MTNRILLVEDDASARDVLERYLRRQGFDVHGVDCGRRALATLQTDPADLVVLDVGLPDLDGLQVLTQLRRGSEVPVIMLSGESADHDRTIGLEMGADDCVAKPPFLPELAARCRAVLRRGAPRTPAQRIEHGGLVIDHTTREVTVEGIGVELRQREFDLLWFLASHPRQVFSREQLLETVWGSSAGWQLTSTVTEHMRRLRQKVEPDPGCPRWLKTARGVGYRFEP